MEELLNQPIVLVTFGLGLAIIYGVRHFGLKAGERAAPANSPAAAQVAAVIVDPTALNSARDAVAALTKTIVDGQGLEKDHAHMICRRIEGLTGAVEDLTRGITDLRVDLAKRR